MIKIKREVEKEFKSMKKSFRYWAQDHHNFMTPYIIELYDYNGYVIEVSEGKGINDTEIYGVSLFEYDKEQNTFKPADFDIDLNGCCSEYIEAVELVKVIKNKIDERPK